MRKLCNFFVRNGSTSIFVGRGPDTRDRHPSSDRGGEASQAAPSEEASKHHLAAWTQQHSCSGAIAAQCQAPAQVPTVGRWAQNEYTLPVWEVVGRERQDHRRTHLQHVWRMPQAPARTKAGDSCIGARDHRGDQGNFGGCGKSGSAVRGVGEGRGDHFAVPT